jgi:hypothetical protein
VGQYVMVELGLAASGSEGQHQAHARASLALVRHRIDTYIHMIKYMDLACTTVDSTRSALILIVPYHPPFPFHFPPRLPASVLSFYTK